MLKFKTTTKQDIIDNYSQELLFEKYLGERVIFGKSYKNPLRNDRSPGCSFFYKNDILYFNDFSSSKIYNIFDFIMNLYNCSFNESIYIIENESHNFNIGKIIIGEYRDKIKKESDGKLIQFEPKEFTNLALSYWNEYEISKNELNRENIYQCNRVWINKYEQKISELTFAYFYPDIQKVKIYQPFSEKKYKWRSTVPNNYVEGIDDLTFDTNCIIITKSKKDRIVLKKIFPDVCNIQAENIACITESFNKFLDDHYTKKLCFFDNDKTGKETNMKLNEMNYGWINIPNEFYDKYGIKDPSDYLKEFKEYELLKTIIEKKCKKN
jgi:hypothetical protein